VSTATTPSTVELKSPRPAVLRDLTDTKVRQSIEDEALSDTRHSIDRYLRRKDRDHESRDVL
jgi:hypothetical protein